MTKYARFDPSVDGTAPVTGWYDTDFLKYDSMPPDAELLVLTDAEWESHLHRPVAWGVSGGKLVQIPPPAPVLSAKHQAAVDLAHRVARGIEVECRSNSESSAIYPIDATAITRMGEMARDHAMGLGLPGGRDTLRVRDIAGNDHLLTGDQIVALYRAARNLLHLLEIEASHIEAGGLAEWPAQTARID